MLTKLIIGVDEAGYGPSMGPLTICATAWRVPHDMNADDIRAMLEPDIMPKPWSPSASHIPIGDSKKIYREPHAKAGLELGARFLVFALTRTDPVPWEAAFSQIAIHDWSRICSVPWFAGMTKDTLRECDEDLGGRLRTAQAKLQQCGIELVGLQMRILDEPEFNRLVDQLGNKATLLSEASLGLVREILLALARTGESVEVYCDKHGGRNRYQALLSYSFDQAWFTTEIEGRTCSRYVALWNDHTVQIQFQVEGDGIFPSSAASIMAKWTREYLMERLNEFWSLKVPGGIAPTAGYYVDAVRFASQMDSQAKSLKLDRDQWWRKK
ncbi:MAG: hypothetical protein ABL921_08895 [Pirellula sp.]